MEEAKQLIVEFCRTHRQYIDKEFCDPLTEEEYQSILVLDNWNCRGEDDCYFDDGSFAFNCEPMDDQLRAYVSKDLTQVIVQGE